MSPNHLLPNSIYNPLSVLERYSHACVDPFSALPLEPLERLGRFYT